MRLEVGKQASPQPVAHNGTDLDGLVYTMNESRDRPQIIIRSLEVHDPRYSRVVYHQKWA